MCLTPCVVTASDWVDGPNKCLFMWLCEPNWWIDYGVALWHPGKSSGDDYFICNLFVELNRVHLCVYVLRYVESLVCHVTSDVLCQSMLWYFIHTFAIRMNMCQFINQIDYITSHSSSHIYQWNQTFIQSINNNSSVYIDRLYNCTFGCVLLSILLLPLSINIVFVITLRRDQFMLTYSMGVVSSVVWVFVDRYFVKRTYIPSASLNLNNFQY